MQMRIGDKVVEVDRIENGRPVIRGVPERTVHPNGRVDVTIRVPCLRMQAQLQKGQ